MFQTPHRSPDLEQVGISEGSTQAEDVLSFGMFWNRLHDGAVHDDEVFWRLLYAAPLARLARVEQQCGALQAHPVALPAAFSGQLHLVFLPQQPLLHGEIPSGR